VPKTDANEANDAIDVAKNGPESDDSDDVFGDTFCDMDLADMSMNDAKNDGGRTLNDASGNAGNKSCPKTPGFDVCTEELLLEESGGQAQVSICCHEISWTVFPWANF